MSLTRDEFFELKADDANFPDRWFLSRPIAADGVKIDPREFTKGRTYQGPAPLQVPMTYEGKQVAFNLAAYDMPVVSMEVERILRKLAPDDVEFYPVYVGPAGRDHAILNVIKACRCVDEELSSIRLFTEADGRPDKIGKYLMIRELRIDPGRVAGAKIFRIADFEIALVVHVSVKETLEECENLGVRFTPVG